MEDSSNMTISSRDFKKKFQIYSGVFLVFWIGGFWLNQIWLSSIAAIFGGIAAVRSYKDISVMMFEAQERRFGFSKNSWYPKFNRIIIIMLGVGFILGGFLTLFNFQPIQL